MRWHFTEYAKRYLPEWFKTYLAGLSDEQAEQMLEWLDGCPTAPVDAFDWIMETKPHLDQPIEINGEGSGLIIIEM